MLPMIPERSMASKEVMEYPAQVKLPLCEIEPPFTPKNIVLQGTSPFALRKISSPMNYPPLVSFHSYPLSAPPQAVYSQCNSPAQGYIFTRSPLNIVQNYSGYVDFSAALNDPFMTNPQQRDTSPIRTSMFPSSFIGSVSPQHFGQNGGGKNK